jgi:mannitol-1-/sugar-/sorbitol-6-phosphatase
MNIYGTVFDAFLFDMDGTILTSIPVVERAWTAWANRAGVAPGEVLDYLHGRPARDTIGHFAPPGADLATELAWLDARELEDMDGILPIPGVGDLLAQLPPDRWAVVTSANGVLARQRIAAARLPVPRVLISSDDVTKGKPDPEGFRRAADELRWQIQRCLVVEDTAVGLRAGLAAGAQVLRILGTTGSEAVRDVPSVVDYNELSVAVGPMGLLLGRAA